MTPPPLPLGKRALALVAAAILLLGFCWALWSHPARVLALFVLAGLSHFPFALGLLPGVWWRHSECLPHPRTDLPRRRPVWSALSELYLDTELEEADWERLAAVLVRSGYSLGQLEEILYRELHPVLHRNLLSVAGEWSAFDVTWLETKILEKCHSGGRSHSSSTRLPFALVFGKWMVQREWANIAAKLGSAGSTDPGRRSSVRP